MLKNILKLEGAQPLTKKEQKSINGGYASNYCNELDTCDKSIGSHDCVDKYGGTYLSICNCCIMMPV